MTAVLALVVVLMLRAGDRRVEHELTTNERQAAELLAARP